MTNNNKQDYKMPQLIQNVNLETYEKISNQTPLSRKVLYYLVSSSRYEKEKVCPSIQRIATYCQISERQAIRIIHEYEELGLLTVLRHSYNPKKEKRDATNIYVVNPILFDYQLNRMLSMLPGYNKKKRLVGKSLRKALKRDGSLDSLYKKFKINGWSNNRPATKCHVRDYKYNKYNIYNYEGGGMSTTLKLKKERQESVIQPNVPVSRESYYKVDPHELMSKEELQNHFSGGIATLLNRAQREYNYILEHGEFSVPITINKHYNTTRYVTTPLLSRKEALYQLVNFTKKEVSNAFTRFITKEFYKLKERNIINLIKRNHQSLGDAYFLIEELEDGRDEKERCPSQLPSSVLKEKQ